MAFVSVSALIAFIPFLITKKIGKIIEVTLIIVNLAYLFIAYPFTEAMMLFSLMAMMYGNLGVIFNKNKRDKRHQLRQELSDCNYRTINQAKDIKRIGVDITLAVVISAGAIVFLLFAPQIYSVLKFLIGIGLITLVTQLITRVGNALFTKIYWLPQQERLIILSTFESRDLPVNDLQEVHIESSPDLLKLHPLFTFLSENQDYTTSFHQVLRLSFPSENIYFTPKGIRVWQNIFLDYVDDDGKQEKYVLPLWHPKNLKRLFWKGYFAMTVKGISAYTGLLFILIWLDVPSHIMITFVIMWWVFNLYVSDRVLIAGADAEEITEGRLYTEAQELFRRAGIPKTKLFLIDSPVHNGLATGMNIGRGTIMLTTATTQLSIESIRAILAHEIIHIKKCDVLINQVARMMMFLFLGLIIYVFFDYVTLLAENMVLFIITIYLTTMVLPIYLSFVAQLTEVRADFLGGKLLVGGTRQMAEGLQELGLAQDAARDKKIQYSITDEKPMKNISNTARDHWFFRFIEFQFQAHPPLYWRIKTLHTSLSWRQIVTAWLDGRIKESLPDWGKRKVNS